MAEARDPKISIGIRSNQDGMVNNYTICRDTKMTKLLQSYCSKKSYDYSTMAFLIDGKLFHNHNKTPEELKWDDEIVIDAMTHATGGGNPSCQGNIENCS